MKIYNWILLALAFLLLVTEIIPALNHRNSSEFIIPLWLFSIPLISLVTKYHSDKRNHYASLRFGAIYNGLSAIVIIAYAISINTLSTHPAAFAVLDMMLAFVLAIAIGINSVLMYSEFKNKTASNKANALGQ